MFLPVKGDSRKSKSLHLLRPSPTLALIHFFGSSFLPSAHELHHSTPMQAPPPSPSTVGRQLFRTLPSSTASSTPNLRAPSPPPSPSVGRRIRPPVVAFDRRALDSSSTRSGDTDPVVGRCLLQGFNHVCLSPPPTTGRRIHHPQGWGTQIRLPSVVFFYPHAPSTATSIPDHQVPDPSFVRSHYW